MTPPPEEQANLNALSNLLEMKGLNASDFIDVINALSNIKQRDAAKEEKEEAKASTIKNKIFVDKEFVFEGREDAFIYKDGRTKSGRYFLRIYDANTKRVFSQSLRTTNRIEALSKAQELYAESRHRMKRGVVFTSINTKQLVDIYLKERFKERTNIPHQGITYRSYDTLIKQLKNWSLYVESKKLTKRNIEDIPTEFAIGFGEWLLNRPKETYTNERYKGTERSRQTINSNIAAVKKMYKDIAITQKYITMAEFPQFKYLKVQKDSTPKRDVLTEEEYIAIRKWMQYKWVNEKGITSDEKLKRRQYGFYFTLHHQMGGRTKEMLGIKWGDISVIPTDKPEDKKIRRAVFISAQNSKTGKSRSIVAPIASTLESMQKLYKSIGVECGKDDYVFQHISKTRRGQNVVWGQPLIDKRLKSVCALSADAGVWEPDGRNITNYSARHYFATQAIMRRVDIYDIALNMGTSIQYLQSTYIHATTLMKADDITKGQGMYKVLEERKEKRDIAVKAIDSALREDNQKQIK